MKKDVAEEGQKVGLDSDIHVGFNFYYKGRLDDKLILNKWLYWREFMKLAEASSGSLKSLLLARYSYSIKK